MPPRQIENNGARSTRTAYEWNSLDHFLSADFIPSGLHRMPVPFCDRNLLHEFYARVIAGTTLLCHFHGNAPRGQSTLPVITGFGVTSDINVSMFVPSDPLLAASDDLSLGWHYGGESLPLQEINNQIIMKLAKVGNAPHIVAWGGSGGGFAALRTAIEFSNATALVWNPQTAISQYAKQFVERYKAIAFPRATGSEIPRQSSGQYPDLTCTALMGRVVYLQEASDWHAEKHMRPFLQAHVDRDALPSLETPVTAQLSNKIFLHLARWGQGHVPPPKYIISRLLTHLSIANWNEAEQISAELFEAAS